MTYSPYLFIITCSILLDCCVPACLHSSGRKEGDILCLAGRKEEGEQATTFCSFPPYLFELCLTPITTCLHSDGGVPTIMPTVEECTQLSFYLHTCTACYATNSGISM